MASAKHLMVFIAGVSSSVLLMYFMLTSSVSIGLKPLKSLFTIGQHYLEEEVNTLDDDYLQHCGPNCTGSTILRNQSVEFYLGGNLKCVLCVYNRKLAEYRQKILYKTVTPNKNDTYRKIIGNENCKEYYGCDYFGIIEQFAHIFTLKVSWKSLTESNWTKADFPIKHHYESFWPPTTHCKSDSESAECLYHISSQANLTKSYILPPHEVFVPNQGYPQLVFFLHVVHDGMVDHRGSTRSGKLDLLHHQCRIRKFRDVNPKKFVDELFTINEYYGDVYYHAHVDSMTRLAPYLEFLKNNPSIYIHVGTESLKKVFVLLGLSTDRLITGHYRARIIYIPQGNGCGDVQQLQEQILYTKYQEYINKNIDPGPRNSLMLIMRSTRRFLVQEKEVAVMLEKLAKQGNLTFEKFKDNPPPSFVDQIKMFARAKIVVAPHGAGLSNLMYARPETRVVEILLSGPIDCYRKLAMYSGMSHVGLLSLNTKDDINLEVDVQYLEKLVASMVKAVQTEG